MSRKAGVDGHKQHSVKIGQYFVKRRKRCAGVKHQHGLGSAVAYSGKGALNVRLCLNVKAHIIARTQVKPVQLEMRFRNHQVNVKRNVAALVQLTHKIGAESVVLHENAVHYVDVQVFYPAVGESFQLVAEM